MSAIKKILYKSLSLENYLRVLQSSYFILYNSGILRLSGKFDYHYDIKKFINKGDTILDIGANLGYYSIPFAKWTGPTGRVLSVEPIGLYNKVFMRRARRYPQITLLPYALGPEEKRVEMVTSLSAGYLQTGHPHVDGVGEGAIPQANDAPELRFEAQMRTPAQLFGSLERLDWVKCDVEGFEYEVLSGMRNILERLCPTVQVEVWPANQARMTELFAGLGYEPFRLERGRLVSAAESTTDGDMIFVPGGK